MKRPSARAAPAIVARGHDARGDGVRQRRRPGPGARRGPRPATGGQRARRQPRSTSRSWMSGPTTSTPTTTWGSSSRRTGARNWRRGTTGRRSTPIRTSSRRCSIWRSCEPPSGPPRRRSTSICGSSRSIPRTPQRTSTSGSCCATPARRRMRRQHLNEALELDPSLAGRLLTDPVPPGDQQGASGIAGRPARRRRPVDRLVARLTCPVS